jgi:hypothetical protein
MEASDTLLIWCLCGHGECRSIIASNTSFKSCISQAIVAKPVIRAAKKKNDGKKVFGKAHWCFILTMAIGVVAGWYHLRNAVRQDKH